MCCHGTSYFQYLFTKCLLFSIHVHIFSYVANQPGPAMTSLSVLFASKLISRGCTSDVSDQILTVESLELDASTNGRRGWHVKPSKTERLYQMYLNYIFNACISILTTSSQKPHNSNLLNIQE